MSTTIKTNMDAMRTFNLMEAHQTQAYKRMEKISSGMKLNSPADDASAYAISERMRVRIRALDQASSNTNHGSNMIKTADDAVSTILAAMRTLKEKAIDAANDSNSDEERRIMQKEFNQLVDQIDEDALVTFNGMNLIDGTKNNAFQPARTILLNQSLDEATKTTDVLTSLKNRAGESLGIQKTDYYEVAWVMKGEISTTGRVQVGDTTTLADLFERSGVSELQKTINGKITGITDKQGKDVYTLDKTEGLAISSLGTGEDAVEKQIAAFTVSITDQDGNVRKSVNAVLDQFNQFQRAETKTGDQSLSFQVGADANFASKFALSDLRAASLGLKGVTDNKIVSISTKEDANATINVLDNAIKKVLDQQTTLGAALSRLERTSTNLSTIHTNDQASESVIRDADMAKEMTEYTKYNILSQASQAMFAQANQRPGNVLSLLNSVTE